MSHLLKQELAHHEYLRYQLGERFPEADEETLRDTLEGLTNLNEMIAVVVRSRLDDLSMAEALKSRIADMQERMSRIKTRADGKKDMLAQVMDRARLKKITEPDFTLSLRAVAPGLIITDEAEIPADFFIEQAPKLDRKLLLTAMRDGYPQPGATLGNGSVTTSIRTK